MLQWLERMNSKSGKWLWTLVIIGVLAAIPLVWQRVQTEQSAPAVEVVFDYRDLVEASAYQGNPELYLQNHLKKMKSAGITSMSLYESTLDEFKLSRRIQMFNASEVSILTGKLKSANENFTYLLFTSQEAQDKLQPLIEQTFRDRLRVNVTPWTLNNSNGLIIEMAPEEAVMKPMLPDPITMDLLKKEGFHIVARLSNRIQPFSAAALEPMLAELKQRGVKTILFDGTAVTGFDLDSKKSEVVKTAELFKKYGMHIAFIEMQKLPQGGFNQLASLLNYQVIRLHSVTERDANLEPDKIIDRLELAVTDRGIRMLFLNTRIAKDSDKGVLNDYMDNYYKSLEGPSGAIAKITAAGHPIGQAEPFVNHFNPVLRYLKPLVMLGSMAIIALFAGLYFRRIQLPLFLIGIVGSAGLYVLKPALVLQAIALGASISAPTVGLILVIHWLRRLREDRNTASTGAKISLALTGFVRSLVISLIGSAFVIGLLNGMTYNLGLEQFRGVNLLYFLPIALVGIYVLFFDEAVNLKESWGRLVGILRAKINILWIVIAGVAVAGLWYYLSRTGNEGQASDYEKLFRTLLENTLGVRPRTKELLAHPLMLLGIYLAMMSRHARYLLPLGVIGQLSIVGTFAHLHTPFVISLLRITYGVVIGLVLGLLLIAVWNLAARSGKRWLRLQRK
ncbi:DUF5693 family protein [Paenibacillus sp. y28]|uniref:DUF5693 family protein n=1 Tax=Paenibacillus sp. y28 TaxID=3129110 RepID=UPI00301987A2